MIKIYFDNKPVLLVNDAAEAEEHLRRPSTIFIDDLTAPAVHTMISEMQQEKTEAGVFLHHDLEELLTAFRKKMKVIVAAGGVVHTPEQKILLIYRRAKWDLPKGKLDEDEDIQSCAVREVKEETGLQETTIQQPLQTTYHCYQEKNGLILKETKWFLMLSEEQPLHPQTNEDIEECRWVPANELPAYLTGSYLLVQDVINEALEKWGC